MTPSSKIPRPVRTDDPGTMAKETAAKRWPDIIQRLIASFQDSCAEAGPEAQAEGDAIKSGLKRLVKDIQADQSIQRVLFCSSREMM